MLMKIRLHNVVLPTWFIVVNNIACSALLHLIKAQQFVNNCEQCEKHITLFDLVLQVIILDVISLAISEQKWA